MKTGKLPTDWKNAQITALYKKGKKTCASNYRPVSLTSIVSKCMEKIIREHIVSYFKINNLFTKNNLDS